jgi:hypothetical protein
MCFKCGASGGEDIKFKYLNNGIGKPSTVSMHKVQHTSSCLDINKDRIQMAIQRHIKGNNNTNSWHCDQL